MSESVLEDLPYNELKDRAFALAEKRHDLRFFIDLFEHAPALASVADEGGSLGDVGGSISGTIEAAQQTFGEASVGDFEPLFRAVFATYIREHGEH